MAECMCVSKKGTDRAELIVNLCSFGVSCLIFVFDRKLMQANIIIMEVIDLGRTVRILNA